MRLPGPPADRRGRAAVATPVLVLVLLVLPGVLAGCATPGAPSTSPTGAASTTPTASDEADGAPSTAAAEPAVVQGAVCYPSDHIPAMTAYFEETTTGAVTSLDIAEGQASYEVSLEPGTYVAFAYRTEVPTLGGAYTAAVPCGLDATCTDHSLLAVTVVAGQTATGVDLCDWYDQSVLPPDPAAG